LLSDNRNSAEDSSNDVVAPALRLRSYLDEKTWSHTFLESDSPQNAKKVAQFISKVDGFPIKSLTRLA
jgi:hypothetical protein